MRYIAVWLGLSIPMLGSSAAEAETAGGTVVSVSRTELYGSAGQITMRNLSGVYKYIRVLQWSGGESQIELLFSAALSGAPSVTYYDLQPLTSTNVPYSYTAGAGVSCLVSRTGPTISEPEPAYTQSYTGNQFSWSEFQRPLAVRIGDCNDSEIGEVCIETRPGRYRWYVLERSVVTPAQAHRLLTTALFCTELGIGAYSTRAGSSNIYARLYNGSFGFQATRAVH